VSVLEDDFTFQLINFNSIGLFED